MAKLKAVHKTELLVSEAHTVKKLRMVRKTEKIISQYKDYSFTRV